MMGRVLNFNKFQLISTNFSGLLFSFWPLYIFLLLFLYYFAPVLAAPNSMTLGYWGDKIDLIQQIPNGISKCTSQPLLQGVAVLTARFVSPLAAYNWWVMLSFPLAFGLAYLLFRKFFSFSIAASLALVFTFSPHHIYQSYNHLALVQTWIVPLVFLALLWLEEGLNRVRPFITRPGSGSGGTRCIQKGRTLSKFRKFGHSNFGFVWNFGFRISNFLRSGWSRAVVVGVVFAAVTLVSNYYGFFALLTAAAFGLVGTIPRPKVRPCPACPAPAGIREVGPFLRRATTYLLLAATCLTIVAFSRFAVLKAGLTQEGGCSPGIFHAIEGFTLYSSRPWHFLIPPVDHPILGDWARGVQATLSEKDYFLFTPFFPEEQGGLFLGWVNLFLVCLALITLISPISRISPGSRRRILTFLFLAIFLAVLSAPPFFTLSDHTIYLPSWLILRFFPMFRCLSRLGIFILPCVLVLVGHTLTWLRSHLKKRLIFANYQLPITGYELLLTTYCLLALLEFLLLPDPWPLLPSLF